MAYLSCLNHLTTGEVAMAYKYTDIGYDGSSCMEVEPDYCDICGWSCNHVSEVYLEDEQTYALLCDECKLQNSIDNDNDQ
jgi:hypothetical protein